jgi:hypothetical protein
VVPGVRELLVVNPSQGSFKKWAKLGGGISAIAEAEEEVTQSGLFVLPATGEANDPFCHTKYKSAYNPRGMSRMGRNIQKTNSVAFQRAKFGCRYRSHVV